MPAHQEAFNRLAVRLLSYDGDRARQDQVLDQWIDYRDRATEWDAAHWGLTDLDEKFRLFDSLTERTR